MVGGGAPPAAAGSAGGRPWLLYPRGRAAGQGAGANLSHAPERYESADAGLLLEGCMPGDASRVFKNVSEPALVPFLLGPSDPGATNAAVIIVPGFAYEFLSWEKEVLPAAAWLNSMGITAFGLKYRVPLRSEQQFGALADLQRATGLVRAHAGHFGLSPARIGVLGFGAGGGLAVDLWAASQMAPEGLGRPGLAGPRPDFILAAYPTLPGAPPSPRLGAAPAAAGPAPPIFITGTGDDGCSSSAGVLTAAGWLSQYGPAVLETHIYPWGGHGYGLCDLYLPLGRVTPACGWTERAAEFIDRYVLKLPAPEKTRRDPATGAMAAG